MTMKQFTEEYGARNDILRQAVFYPPEGLSYGEFLKVLLPPQQAVGRRLLQQGYLIRNEAMRIILSPIVKKELHLQPVWDENTHTFLTRLVLCLAEAIITSRKADKWAEQAHSDPEQLRMLVFQHSRENLPPFQMQLAREALSLYSKGQTLTVVPGSKREFLVSATIAIEKSKNKWRLEQEAAIIVPTLESVLNLAVGIPEKNLCDALDWLSELYLELEDEKAERYVNKWRLASAAASHSFEPVLRGLGILYSPLAGDQTVGAMLQRWKERR